MAKKNIEVIYYKNLTFSRKNQIGKGGIGRVFKGLYLKSEVAINDNFQDEMTFEI